jgi:hypothetical protein
MSCRSAWRHDRREGGALCTVASPRFPRLARTGQCEHGRDMISKVGCADGALAASSTGTPWCLHHAPVQIADGTIQTRLERSGSGRLR